jgi:hypothetical protein
LVSGASIYNINVGTPDKRNYRRKLIALKATTEVTVRNVVNSLNLENSALVRAVFISTIQNPFAWARKGRK